MRATDVRRVPQAEQAAAENSLRRAAGFNRLRKREKVGWIDEKRPSGAKARVDLNSVMYGLKPVPFRPKPDPFR